jgi:hypothetical protein
VSRKLNRFRGEPADVDRFALKRIKRTQVRKGMVLVAKTETPPKGLSAHWCQVIGLIHSGQEIRMYGHGPPPLEYHSTEISSNDALWCYPRTFQVPSFLGNS